MGKKYRALKLALKLVPERALQVIDDTKIRNEKFSAGLHWLKKIDSLSAKIDKLNTDDQLLFDQWYQLTFRNELKKMEDQAQKIREIYDLHNQIVALSHMEDIPMWQAYQRISLENEQYESASPDLRLKIEELRKERMSFAHEEAMREADFEDHSDLHGAFSDEIFDDVFDDLNDDSTRQPFELTPEDKANFEELKSMPKDAINKILSHPDIACEYLFELAKYSGLTENYDFFVNIWKITPKNSKLRFEKFFQKHFGEPLQFIWDHIAAIKESSVDMDSDFEFEAQDDNRSNDEFENAGAFQFDRQARKKASSASLTTNEMVQFKSLYRYLVRLLHPDSHSQDIANRQRSWLNLAWEKLQLHSKAKDIKSLEKLKIVTLLQLQKLNDLTLDEIESGVKLIASDFLELEAKARQLKKLPAWNFSKKKSYASLEKKLRREIDGSLEHQQDAIFEISKYHESLKKYADYEANRRQSKSIRKSARKSKKTKRSQVKIKKESPRGSQNLDDDQLNFW